MSDQDKTEEQEPSGLNPPETTILRASNHVLSNLLDDSGKEKARLVKLLKRLVDAWEGIQPDLDELQNSLVGVQALVDLAKRELAQSPPKEEPKEEPKTGTRIEVLVVEPHEYIRRHIKETLDGSPNTAPLFDCTMTDNTDAVMGLIDQQEYDVVLLAFGFKLGRSTALLRTIRGAHESLPVLMLGTGTEQQYFTESLKNGGHGYLVTDAILDELVEAIRTVVDGQTYTSKVMRGGADVKA